MWKDSRNRFFTSGLDIRFVLLQQQLADIAKQDFMLEFFCFGHFQRPSKAKMSFANSQLLFLPTLGPTGLNLRFSLPFGRFRPLTASFLKSRSISRLFSIIFDYFRLLSITLDYSRLLSTTTLDYSRLLSITLDYSRLLSVALDYSRLLSITLAYSHLLFRSLSIIFDGFSTIP